MQAAVQKAFTPPIPGESIFVQHSNTTYTFGQPIGNGHFGLVFACTDEWNNDLAAKVLKPLRRSHAEVGQAGSEEIEKLLAVRHPHITHPYDAFEWRDTFYLITERCHESLHDQFTRGAITMFSLLTVARCLLQAVHFIHRTGLVHQDIHPGNIFLTYARDGQGKKPWFAPSSYKLGDLGVAKPISEVAAAQTRGWLPPPEVIQPSYGPADHRIDIYHAGLLLLQVALLRELHFTREQILEGVPGQMAHGLQSPVNFALEKALRRRVEWRTQSAKEMWLDLKAPIGVRPSIP